MTEARTPLRTYLKPIGPAPAPRPNDLAQYLKPWSPPLRSYLRPVLPAPAVQPHDLRQHLKPWKPGA